jgi:hypothetical protein
VAYSRRRRCGSFPPHRALLSAPGTLRLLRRLPDRSMPITPDAVRIIAVRHDYANSKTITGLESKIPEHIGKPGQFDPEEALEFRCFRVERDFSHKVKDWMRQLVCSESGAAQLCVCSRIPHGIARQITNLRTVGQFQCTFRW